MGKLFYKPHDGWLADVIPFYEDGEFKLLYLKDWRNPEAHGEGTPWFLLGTKDFLSFTEYGEVLPRGGRGDQDLYIYTGCILKVEGVYHIFYTGNNFHYPAQGKKQQAVMHATSTDMIHWSKIAADTFFAPEDRYEPHDWRDPFVFWNEEAGEYWMLLAARLKEGPANRRGCVALCASPDLQAWEVRDPFWAPYLYTTHECPDLFRIGEWWYLVYSTFSDRTVTHYRMSRSLAGPWVAPENDTFDNRAFYAAKTWTDGESRYAFGWNPTREGEHDQGTWQWGGHLVVHELVQQPDGSLLVKAPDSIAAAFTREVRAAEVVQDGQVQGKLVQREASQVQTIQEQQLQAEAVQVKSAQEQQAQAEPLQVKSAQEQQVQGEAVRIESTQEQQVQGEAAQVKSTQEQQVQAEPLQVKSTQEQQVQAEAVQAGLVHEGLVPVLGSWERHGRTLAAGPLDGFACAAAALLPDEAYKLEATVTFGANTRACGLVLRTDSALERGYMLRLEPGRNRLVFDQWPRKGDIPYAVGLERPIELQAGEPYRLQVFVEDTVCVVYVNEAVALSARLYDHPAGGWGVFVSEGSASFEARLLLLGSGE